MLQANLVQQLLHARAVDAGGLQVQQDQMVVRAARDDGVAQLNQPARTLSRLTVRLVARSWERLSPLAPQHCNRGTHVQR